MSRTFSLATCGRDELFQYVKDRAPYAGRQKLIFAAGALKNRKLLDELGSMESSTWHEDRRAADPSYENPYY